MHVARLIAFYLPQFHPVPENDEWWGKGFTEWTNTAKAKPLFPGHYQPHVPADLGFCDLRVPETREAQAQLAGEYGIEAFCYYHYWFGGRRILNRPFDEVLASGQPDLPFCLCWANESWTGVWHGLDKRILIEQSYPGAHDHQRHFEALLPAFRDPRYVRVDGKPLFLIYSPGGIPDRARVLQQWRSMARSAGLEGLHLVAVIYGFDWSPEKHGFDGAVMHRLYPKRDWYTMSEFARKTSRLALRILRWPSIYSYKRVLSILLPETLASTNLYPCLIPNWDNTPRSGRRGLTFHGSTPELFRQHVQAALQLTKDVPPARRLIFVKSWNEWAEGNHLEPDLRYGRRYLEVLRDELEIASVLGQS